MLEIILIGSWIYMELEQSIEKIKEYENDNITLNSHISDNELITNVSDLPVAVFLLDSRITIEGFPGKTFDYLSMNKISAICFK